MAEQISHRPLKPMKVEDDDQLVSDEQNLDADTVGSELKTKTADASNALTPSKDFISWINDVPENAERAYGKTKVGQWFCLVLIKLIENKSYETRLYMDEDHRNKDWIGPWYQFWEEARYIEKESWISYKKANDHITARKHKLEQDLIGEKVYMRVRKMPKDCAENPARYLNLGDHIQSPLVDGWIHHVGIYAGDEQVYHISPHSNGMAEAWAQKLNSCCRTGKVCPDFADTPTTEIRVVVYRIRLRERQAIVNSASSLANLCYRDGDYDLLRKNCQHFASLCACGEEYMTDAPQLWVTGGIVAGIVGLLGFAAYVGNVSAREQARREEDQARAEQDRANAQDR